jgi:hypothetical protein
MHGWQNIPTEFGYLYGFIDLAKSKVNDISNKPIYRLDESDVPLVNEIMRNIHACLKSTKYRSLDETLRKFNSSYYGNLEDRLIDQMIAFESLYISDDKELSYKLSLRTAFFLSRKRRETFTIMKKAYDLRGHIVHGQEQVDESKLEKTIPKTEEYLRQSIQKFLRLSSKGKSLKEIRDKLDENILTNGRTLAHIG